MKPFDLEAAKRGDPIVHGLTHKPVSFIGASSKRIVVFEDADGVINHAPAHMLRMAPRKQTVWVNFYKSDDGPIWSNTFKTLDSADNNAIHATDRVSGKAYPVEIEE